MESKNTEIAKSELNVMQRLWESDEPMTAAELCDEMQRLCGWDASTTKTLLRRLCQKGAAIAEKRDVLHYRPLISEQEYSRDTTDKLISKFYGGSARNLVAALVKDERLSAADVEELRRALGSN